MMIHFFEPEFFSELIPPFGLADDCVISISSYKVDKLFANVVFKQIK